jgi:hypothetical protein
MTAAQRLQESILETLLIRFGAVPECLVGPVRAMEDERRLRDLEKAATVAGSIDEFERAL